MRKWKRAFELTKLDILDRILGNSHNQETTQHYPYSRSNSRSNQNLDKSNFPEKTLPWAKQAKEKSLHSVIYGIQASKGMRLTNIVRSFVEEIPLKKTQSTTVREINDGNLTEFLDKKLTEEGQCRLKDRGILALDLSNISKQYSKKQEFVVLAGDGDQKGKVRKGCWTLEILGADPRGDKIVPQAVQFSPEQHERQNNPKLIFRLPR